jgi:hypothetical protein
MKLVLPYPENLPVTHTPVASTARLGEAILTVGPIGPMPFDLMGWRNATLQAVTGGGEVQLVGQEQATTRATAWPVNLFVSDVVAGGETKERRLHAFFLFAERGAIAVLSGTPEAVDAVMAQARDLLLGAVPDFSSAEVATLGQLWEGFDGNGGGA